MADAVTLSWRLAVEHIELARGLSHGAAHKALLYACRNGEVGSEPHRGDWPDVSEADFWRWLNPPKPAPVKRAKIKAFLDKKFHGQPVPDDYMRKDLVNELRDCGDPSLKSVDDATVKTSIDEYHADLAR